LAEDEGQHALLDLGKQGVGETERFHEYPNLGMIHPNLGNVKTIKKTTIISNT